MRIPAGIKLVGATYQFKASRRIFMSARQLLRMGLVFMVVVVAAMGFHALRTEAAPGGNHCPRGIKPCSAVQVGQPCDANNPNLICSAQANGAYCCLAYAP
jgi:hypothetical protein